LTATQGNNDERAGTMGATSKWYNSPGRS